jgi:hypothetical protein
MILIPMSASISMICQRATPSESHVGGDYEVESFTSVDMLEGADLSLDEPKLEEQMLDDLS